MSTAIVGREPELSAVDSFLDAAGSSFACLVVEGEPGIGKTTIWQEAIHRAEAYGYRTLVARPAQAEVELSFAAMADLLEPVPVSTFESLPEPQRRALDAALLRVSDAGSRAEPRATAAGLRSVLVALAAESPVLVAIDDAQWLDQPSAAALGFAVRRLQGERVGVLTTQRTGRRSPLELAGVARVELDGLSLGAIYELVKNRLGHTPRRPLLMKLYDTCAGNPLFALEIAREVSRSSIGPGDPLPVPADLKRLIRLRLARLSPPARDALLLAAALGNPTSDVLAAALEGDPSAALEEAEQADIVELDGGRIRFAHPLYAAATYSATSPEKRRRLHHTLSRVVVDVEERARHLALATEAPSDEVALELERAAVATRQRGAVLAAATLHLDAARLTPAGEVVARRRRELDAAKAFYDGTDRKTAREILVRLRGELTPGPDRARALLALGLLHSLGGEHTAAKQACAQAIEDARGEARLQAEAHLHFALVCYDDQLAARQSVAAARALVEADPDAPNDLVAAVLLDDAYQGLYLGEGLAEAQVARGLARLPRHRETWLAQRARAVAEAWAKYTDDLLRARELLQESSDREREEGDEVSWSLTIRHLCEVECWLGNWRRAQELATAAHDAMPDANALYGCGLVAAHLGEVAEARHAAEAGLAVASSPWGRATNLSVLGFLELSLGNAAAAVQHLEAAAATVAEAGMPEPVRFRFDGDRVEALVAVGRLAEAEKVVEQLAQRAAATPRPWNRVMHARGLALVRAAKGDLDGALDALEHALREHERLPMPFERARTLLHLGALRRRRNERRAAHDTLSSALEIFETLGAPLWAAQAEEELRRIPIRRKATDNTLTPTEERVAELAASGRTNREVARTLFMSPKTVEANLSRVYRKLEIRSRAELGAVMAARSEGAAASKP